MKCVLDKRGKVTSKELRWISHVVQPAGGSRSSRTAVTQDPFCLAADLQDQQEEEKKDEEDKVSCFIEVKTKQNKQTTTSKHECELAKFTHLI